jgi:hypothetical protein
MVLARRVLRGETSTQWFARHRSTPITELPRDWPSEYRDVAAKRIETIEHHRDIGLIEQPEYKRRWQSEPWEQLEWEALGLAVEPVRGAITVVWAGQAATDDDCDPVGGPPAR